MDNSLSMQDIKEGLWLMKDYYSTKLSSERLKACYDIAPDRTKQYLEAEVRHVLGYVNPPDRVLELGCGFGRFLSRIVGRCQDAVGIDTSSESLVLAKRTHQGQHPLHLFQMNATALGFRDDSFDVVICIQNGMSAFKVSPNVLVLESLRVCRPGGLCLFSSYSSKFWEHRLEWFEGQANAGLIGELDWDATGNGVIVCKDGFRASTYTEKDFTSLLEQLQLRGAIVEVDESSIFCHIKKTAE
jgi:ubiquinone/menaquinone biosynthesis C-methylase UbiE